MNVYVYIETEYNALPNWNTRTLLSYLIERIRCQPFWDHSGRPPVEAVARSQLKAYMIHPTPPNASPPWKCHSNASKHANSYWSCKASCETEIGPRDANYFARARRAQRLIEKDGMSLYLSSQLIDALLTCNRWMFATGFLLSGRGELSHAHLEQTLFRIASTKQLPTPNTRADIYHNAAQAHLLIQQLTHPSQHASNYDFIASMLLLFVSCSMDMEWLQPMTLLWGLPMCA